MLIKDLVTSMPLIYSSCNILKIPLQSAHVLGGFNLENCAIQENIPLWLIVNGAIVASHLALILGSLHSQRVLESARVNLLHVLLGFFHVTWFVTGY